MVEQIEKNDMLFALGPAGSGKTYILRIPYNYSNQYRSSQKLAPMHYSQNEELIRSIADDCDRFYATALQPGSLTALSKGDYYVTYQGVTYAFTLDPAASRTAAKIFT